MQQKTEEFFYHVATDLLMEEEIECVSFFSSS